MSFPKFKDIKNLSTAEINDIVKNIKSDKIANDQLKVYKKDIPYLTISQKDPQLILKKIIKDENSGKFEFADYNLKMRNLPDLHKILRKANIKYPSASRKDDLVEIIIKNKSLIQKTMHEVMSPKKPSPIKIPKTKSVKSVSPKSVKSVSPKSVKSLSPKSVKSVSPRSVKSVSPKSVKSLSPRSVKSLSPKSVKSVSPKSVKSISPRSVKSVSPKSVKSISPRSVSSSKTSSPSKKNEKECKKPCTPEQICNKKTGRCIKRKPITKSKKLKKPSPKTPSPKKKTPSPKKKTPSPKKKTPSPKKKKVRFASSPNRVPQTSPKFRKVYKDTLKHIIETKPKLEENEIKLELEKELKKKVDDKTYFKMLNELMPYYGSILQEYNFKSLGGSTEKERRQNVRKQFNKDLNIKINHYIFKILYDVIKKEQKEETNLITLDEILQGKKTYEETTPSFSRIEEEREERKEEEKEEKEEVEREEERKEREVDTNAYEDNYIENEEYEYKKEGEEIDEDIHINFEDLNIEDILKEIQEVKIEDILQNDVNITKTIKQCLGLGIN